MKRVVVGKVLDTSNVGIGHLKRAHTWKVKLRNTSFNSFSNSTSSPYVHLRQSSDEEMRRIPLWSIIAYFNFFIQIYVKMIHNFKKWSNLKTPIWNKLRDTHFYSETISSQFVQRTNWIRVRFFLYYMQYMCTLELSWKVKKNSAT